MVPVSLTHIQYYKSYSVPKLDILLDRLLEFYYQKLKFWGARKFEKNKKKKNGFYCLVGDVWVGWGSNVNGSWGHMEVRVCC